MKVIRKEIRLLFTFFFTISVFIAMGQQHTLALMDAIEIAQSQSYEAMVAWMNLMSQYWSLRSYKAQLLPSINLSGGLMEFDRSMVETRNYDNGEIRYVENNTLSNSLMLSVDQNIAPLGGTMKMAQADLEATKIRNEQLHDEYIQKIVSDVNSFNIHGAQCKSSDKFDNSIISELK